MAFYIEYIVMDFYLAKVTVFRSCRLSSMDFFLVWL